MLLVAAMSFLKASTGICYRGSTTKPDGFEMTIGVCSGVNAETLIYQVNLAGQETAIVDYGTVTIVNGTAKFTIGHCQPETLYDIKLSIDNWSTSETMTALTDVNTGINEATSKGSVIALFHGSDFTLMVAPEMVEPGSKVLLTDIIGQQVFSEPLSSTTTTTTNAPAGIYIVCITDPRGKVLMARKIAKQ